VNRVVTYVTRSLFFTINNKYESKYIIMENNKLIAEFMIATDGKIKLLCGVEIIVDFTIRRSKDEALSSLEKNVGLQYHSSWNWLTPVVRKIAEDFNVVIYDNDEIEKVHKRVVEFIKES
jgi:hypothetical protein